MFFGFLNHYQRQLAQKLIDGRLSYCPVYDDKACVFVHIPKTAGLSLCRGLFDTDAVGHMPLHYYQRALGDHKYKHYFKFSFVRNPWDRAYSAYNYLLRGGVSKKDLVWRETFSLYSDFNDFVANWMDEDNIKLVLHFMPQIFFLKNAQGVVDFDFIGRFEDLEDDYAKIQERIGGEALKMINKSSSSLSYRDVYTKDSIDKIRQLYARDIDVLGYDFDSQ